MTFPSIRLEGAILSADLLDAVERGDAGKHSPKPADFGLPKGTAVRDDIQSVWSARSWTSPILTCRSTTFPAMDSGT